MPTETSIGLDLGGTQVKAAAFDTSTGGILERITLPTHDGKIEDGIASFQLQTKRAHNTLEELLGAPDAAVGLSSPGLVDASGAFVRTMPGRLHGLENFLWSGFLERPAVPVLNDAHAALLGEIWNGSARGINDVILITIGTGVGGAIVSGGRLLHGHLGRAGHLGHLTVDYQGPPDICNCPGSIEDAIGKHSIRERSGGRFLSTHDLLDALETGDHEAGNIWNTSVRALGAAVASLINILDPEVVLIGGGIAEADHLLLEPLRQSLDEFEWRPDGHRVTIRKAVLGEWAGTHGAAWNAIQKEK